jgi:pre-mRNA-splicing helicase BRR2
MEVVVSRMRYIANEMGDEAFKMIGLSASIANYLDIGEWMGAPSENIFNFHPNVRQNSVEIVFSSYEQSLR